MATNRKARSAARLGAVQALYQKDIMEDLTLQRLLHEFHQHRLGATIEDVTYEDAEVSFFDDIVTGVDALLNEVDTLIAAHLTQDWKPERLDKPIRQILRAGTYELLARKDIPTNVVIGEYLNVAHAFYDRKEARLINGVLDAVAKAVRG